MAERAQEMGEVREHLEGNSVPPMDGTNAEGGSLNVQGPRTVGCEEGGMQAEEGSEGPECVRKPEVHAPFSSVLGGDAQENAQTLLKYIEYEYGYKCPEGALDYCLQAVRWGAHSYSGWASLLRTVRWCKHVGSNPLWYFGSPFKLAEASIRSKQWAERTPWSEGGDLVDEHNVDLIVDTLERIKWASFALNIQCGDVIDAD